MDTGKLERVMKKMAAEKARDRRQLDRDFNQRDRGLGYLIYCARRYKRFSQGALARRINRSHSSLSRWESNTRVPSFTDMQFIAEECDLELMIGLRTQDTGEIVVLAVCFDDWPLNEMLLLEDKFRNDFIPPLPWRKQLEENKDVYMRAVTDL